jgi:hypothetical protein
MKSELTKRGKKDAESKIVSTTSSSASVRTGGAASGSSEAAAGQSTGQIGMPGTSGDGNVTANEVSDEVIAAIAGALAAYGTNGRRLVIKNIRRVQGGSSAWENSGRMDLLQ